MASEVKSVIQFGIDIKLDRLDGRLLLLSLPFLCENQSRKMKRKRMERRRGITCPKSFSIGVEAIIAEPKVELMGEEEAVGMSGTNPLPCAFQLGTERASLEEREGFASMFSTGMITGLERVHLFCELIESWIMFI